MSKRANKAIFEDGIMSYSTRAASILRLQLKLHNLIKYQSYSY